MKFFKITKILPPTYFYSFIGISIILHFIFPIKQLIYSLWSYLGILPICFGIFFNIWVDRLFKKHKTTENPFKYQSSLLLSGPFKISRHPIYLGMIMILVGMSLILGSLIVFLFPILFFLLMELLFIVYEEKNMEKIFKDEYRIYKKKVRRWI
jgi:protein-S-isoprenylcysteine O-methyltransferase Ste14